MKVRRTYKRLNYDSWRPWQKEEYVGIHGACDWVPADDADPHGYQFRPVFVVPSPPVDQSMYRTPQVDSRMLEPRRPSLWERVKKWAAM